MKISSSPWSKSTVSLENGNQAQELSTPGGALDTLRRLLITLGVMGNKGGQVPRVAGQVCESCVRSKAIPSRTEAADNFYGSLRPTRLSLTDNAAGLTANTLEGEPFNFEVLRNKVALITNVASS